MRGALGGVGEAGGHQQADKAERQGKKRAVHDLPFGVLGHRIRLRPTSEKMVKGAGLTAFLVAGGGETA